MAYDSKGLSVLAYANGFTLWHYSTKDNIDEVVSQDYFHAARDMIRHGDVILVVSYWMEECPSFRFFGVFSPEGLGERIIPVPTH